MGINRNKVLNAARKQVRKGNWEKAIGKYRELVDDDPEDARSMLKIADLYSKLDRRTEALDAYGSVARHYANQDIYEKAVAVYKQALRLAPDAPELHRDLGDAYHRLGRLKDAVRSYHKAQKIYKKVGDAHAQRDLLERMIRLDPDDVGLRIQLAERYAKDDLISEALELFEFAADKLDEEGRIDEFVQVAERIIFLRTDALELRERVVDIYLRRGDNKHALKHLQVCFKKRPHDVQILELLVETFRRLERYDKAVLVMHELVNLYRKNSRDQDAAELLEQILELEPQDKRARKLLARMRRLDDSGNLVASSARDTGPVGKPRTSTPAETESVDALDGIEFLDEESDAAFEPVQQPAASNSRSGGQSPPPEQHDRPAAEELPSIEAEPLDDIELIEAVEPTQDIRPEEPEDSVQNLLNETDVFIKYGLYDKAYETIVGIIAKNPDSLAAHEQMRKLQVARGDQEGAADELVEMARIVRTTPSRANQYLAEALDLSDEPARIERAAEEYGLAFDSGAEEDDLAEISVSEVELIDEHGFDEPSEEFLELDVGDVELIDEEPEQLDPSDVEELQHVESSVVEISELQLDEADFDDLEIMQGAEDSIVEVDDLGFDESDFDDADFVDMDIDDMGDIDDSEMVSLSEETDAENGAEVDFALSEEEADQMFDDLFGDVAHTEERVNLGGDDPLGEMAEVDFFLQQGLVTEAEETLEEVGAENPGHPGIQKRRNQIGMARDGVQPSDNPFGSKSLSQKFVPGAENDTSRSDVLDLGEAAFHNTSIELGIAYRDMGLYSEAIDELEQALDDPEAADAAAYHIALCEIEKGEAAAARDRLESLLDQGALAQELRSSAREKLEELQS